MTGTDPKFCSDFEQVIRLEASADGEHYLTCAYPERVRVPETWQVAGWQ